MENGSWERDGEPEPRTRLRFLIVTSHPTPTL
jgi:hypothetical protein